MQDEELIAALLKVEGNRPDSLGISTQWYRNPEGPQAVEALTTAQAEIEALRARVAELEGVLADPNAVHANLLRGDISRPTVHQIIHIYSPAKVRDGLETYARAALSGSQT